MPKPTLSEVVDQFRKELQALRTDSAVARSDVDRLNEQNLNERLLVVELKVERLATESESKGQRVFELMKLILAAALGAAATYFLRK